MADLTCKDATCPNYHKAFVEKLSLIPMDKKCPICRGDLVPVPPHTEPLPKD